MPVIQEGSVNTTGLRVPDVYVQILSPRHSLLNGVPTNILGIVGTATFGPVNVPVTISSMADFEKWFGPVVTNPYDLGTAVAIALLNGSNNMRCVRVTDGSDVSATASIIDNQVTPVEGMLISSKYSGAAANTFKVTVQTGSKANSWKVIIARPNLTPEVFDNIEGTGAELWYNMVDAINNGQSSIRSKSEWVVATLGTSTNPPKEDTFTMSGGTSGSVSVTDTIMVGTDGLSRTGMYALRDSRASVAFLHGVTTSATWGSQVAFGLEEGIYMILTGESGQYDNVADAVTAKQTAGLDSYAAKLMLGDWCYYEDVVNGKIRLVPPQAYVGGRLVNLATSRSALNQQIVGIVATEASDAKKVYSQAEIEELVDGGIDVITNPSPGGHYFSARIGHNSSSNNLIWGDNYTRTTNYIAYTLDTGMGYSIGEPITEDLWSSTAATLNSFLHEMANATPPLIGDPSGNIPYSVQIDSANNPSDIVAKGMMIAQVKVRYLSILEVFLINLEGGQSVVIRESTGPA